MNATHATLGNICCRDIRWCRHGDLWIPDVYSSSSLLKNLNNSAFVLRFSSSYKRSVRLGSECSRFVAMLSLKPAGSNGGGHQFGNAEPAEGGQVDQEIVSCARDAALLGLAHCSVL